MFRALFYGFVFRLRSFKELEADLAQTQLQQRIDAPRAFGDDTLRYSLSGFDLQPLAQMLVAANRQLKRNKAFEPGRVQGQIVAALDGIEILSSYSRCCEDCSQRRVSSTGPDAQPVERIQYFHRAVGCQILSSAVKSFLGVEWVKPGESEDKKPRSVCWPACRSSTAAAFSTSCCSLPSMLRHRFSNWPRT